MSGCGVATQSRQQAEIEIRSDKEGVMKVEFTGVLTETMTCVINEEKKKTTLNVDNVNISSNHQRWLLARISCYLFRK